MRFELHTTDGQTIRFDARTREEAVETACNEVLGNWAWIDYVVGNPRSRDSFILEGPWK